MVHLKEIFYLATKVLGAALTIVFVVPFISVLFVVSLVIAYILNFIKKIINEGSSES